MTGLPGSTRPAGDAATPPARPASKFGHGWGTLSLVCTMAAFVLLGLAWVIRQKELAEASALGEPLNDIPGGGGGLLRVLSIVMAAVAALFALLGLSRKHRLRAIAAGAMGFNLIYWTVLAYLASRP